MKKRFLLSKFLLTILLSTLSLALSAQQKSFADDESFVGDLNSFMGVKTSLNKELKTDVKIVVADLSNQEEIDDCDEGFLDKPTFYKLKGEKK